MASLDGDGDGAAGAAGAAVVTVSTVSVGVPTVSTVAVRPVPAEASSVFMTRDELDTVIPDSRRVLRSSAALANETSSLLPLTVDMIDVKELDT